MVPQLVKVAIVEDQPSIRADIEAFVKKQEGFTVVGSCGSVKAAITLLKQVRADLLLLDVQLIDGTGFDILNETITNYRVVFLTGFEQHAIHAIKHGAFDYILKPAWEPELAIALKKFTQALPIQPEQVYVARMFHNEQKRTSLVLRSQDFLYRVEMSNILYCQSDAGYTAFYLVDGKKILTSKILKEYEDILTEPTFLKPHKSYLVNTSHIEKFKKQQDGWIVLDNGVEIPVAARRKDYVLEYFNNL